MTAVSIFPFFRDGGVGSANLLAAPAVLTVASVRYKRALREGCPAKHGIMHYIASEPLKMQQNLVTDWMIHSVFQTQGLIYRGRADLSEIQSQPHVVLLSL